jgi:hypothetical protein
MRKYTGKKLSDAKLTGKNLALSLIIMQAVAGAFVR